MISAVCIEKTDEIEAIMRVKNLEAIIRIVGLFTRVNDLSNQFVCSGGQHV